MEKEQLLLDITGSFANADLKTEETKDEILTLLVPEQIITELLRHLKYKLARPFSMLYDLTAIDMRAFSPVGVPPPYPFILIYHLLSFERNCDLRIKVGLSSDYPSVPSIIDIWPAANWYEREVYDMFGIQFTGHPGLRRILMPENWVGHPLRKEHPARATDMGNFVMTDDYLEQQEEELQFNPEKFGMNRQADNADFMFLNLGPQHPGTHGILRLILQLSGEDIVDIVPNIGFHHRGAEKMGERQSWHTYIPYTDRVDYLSGVLNNMAYCEAVEKLADISVPDRAKVIRIMLAELFRISSHLVWYGTFAQDIGQMSPVFYMFTDREKVLDIIGAICGARMHPNWFRIGGVAQDLPVGWKAMIIEFLNYLPPRLKEYDSLVMKNQIFKARTRGIGIYNTTEAIEWGITGPGLRATGFEWDLRKKRPYGGYDQFEFDIPVAANGDCFDRALVRIEEIRQSLRIIKQCVDNMPEGNYKSGSSIATPPRKENTMYDIETLIHHFVHTSWGPVIPPGEAYSGIESSKGQYGYYLTSNGSTSSYRTRIRTPSFPHMQMVPFISKGYTVADLLSILGSVDFVLSDIDR
ncbi:MAG: NADH-quinone oxidoreductase subunit C/D [Lentimicrobiaceae bacterium]|nr:NADH-quinone oxidoreductase subunit C/D [Lentimicrobiaceae bacterium]